VTGTGRHLVLLASGPDQPTCFDCKHFGEVQTRDGISSFCMAHNQPIDSEAYEAEDCPTFENDA
jgi:hypothetical protein